MKTFFKYEFRYLSFYCNTSYLHGGYFRVRKIKGNNEKLLFPTAEFKFGKEHKRISFTSL